MDLDHDTLRQYVEFNQERRGVEYKASMPWDSHESKLTKGIMAMANRHSAIRFSSTGRSVITD